jgi:hypothetical protein
VINFRHLNGLVLTVEARNQARGLAPPPCTLRTTPNHWYNGRASVAAHSRYRGRSPRLGALVAAHTAGAGSPQFGRAEFWGQGPAPTEAIGCILAGDREGKMEILVRILLAIELRPDKFLKRRSYEYQAA